MKAGLWIAAVVILAGAAAAVTGLIIKAGSDDRIAALEAELAKERATVGEEKDRIDGLSLSLEKSTDERDLLNEQIAELDRSSAKLATDLKARTGQLEEMRKQLEARPQAAPIAEVPPAIAEPEAEPDLGKAVAGMFENPDMKDVLTEQVRMGIEMVYGPLFTSLELEDAEKEQLMTLYGERAMLNTKASLPLLQKKHTRAEIKAIFDKVKAGQDEVDGRIKKLIGEDRFGRIEEYNKTAGDRMVLSQLRNSLAGTKDPLESYQEEQLMQAIIDEKKNMPDPEGFKSFEDDMSAMLDKAKAAKYTAHLAKVNEVVLLRAKQILRPEQAKAYEGILSQMQRMTVMSMNMMQNMIKEEE